ncbi:hypothetical protein Rhopal_007208-T1 [Rhodotorula paludigena]|uniref:RING-type domain-containing protein n=1 Tax=Rhodotorula paludigena TaxID=86838 RepID=A0AAV5GUC1_9BASI|nr:hypothetical protein Rhopal_007208-T1 [Rhodotorula paludigena]
MSTLARTPSAAPSDPLTASARAKPLPPRPQPSASPANTGRRQPFAIRMPSPPPAAAADNPPVSGPSGTNGGGFTAYAAGPNSFTAADNSRGTGSSGSSDAGFTAYAEGTAAFTAADNPPASRPSSTDGVGFTAYAAGNNAFRAASASGASPAPAPAAGARSASRNALTRSPAPVASTSAARAVPSTSDARIASPAASGSRDDVIDLTSSSPPPRWRTLPGAARASGLSFPGSGSGSGFNPARGFPASSPRMTRATAAARRDGSAARAEELTLSSGDEDSTDESYRPSPSAGPSSLAPRAGPGPRSSTLARHTATSLATSDSDSDIEIISQGPVRPRLPNGAPRAYGFNDVLVGSPPPFVVPPGATATSSSSSSRQPARRSTRRGTGAADADADARLAHELAAEDGGVIDADDYVAAQARALNRANNHSAGARHGFGGVFSRSSTGGAGGAAGAGAGYSFADVMGSFGFATELFGGLSYWPGAGGGGFGSAAQAYLGGFGFGGAGGAGGGGYGATPPGGWGGAAKVRAASRKYAVRMSHPDRVERGFSRDIVEPPDPDAADAAAVVSPARKKAKTGSSKGKDKDPVALEPVCASCLDPLVLGGEGAQKVFALRCGHVVCARCLGDARARCREIRDAEKGRWYLDVDDGPAAGKGRTKDKGKGKGKAPAVTLETDDEADDERSAAKNGVNGKAAATGKASTAKTKSMGSKGKAKSRADETGVEENWTSCPVATCDGRGSDLLATDGWARPFELFA